MKKTTLASLLKEDKKEIKKPINEGMLTNVIAGVLKLIYAGKTKQLASNLGTINQDLAKAALGMQKSIAEFDKFMDDPETQEVFRELGITDIPRPTSFFRKDNIKKPKK